MAKIPASEVAITPVLLVDCAVCDEAVIEDAPGLGNSYGYYTRKDAQEAKRRHLERHKSGDIE